MPQRVPDTFREPELVCMDSFLFLYCFCLVLFLFLVVILRVEGGRMKIPPLKNNSLIKFINALKYENKRR